MMFIIKPVSLCCSTSSRNSDRKWKPDRRRLCFLLHTGLTWRTGGSVLLWDGAAANATPVNLQLGTRKCRSDLIGQQVPESEQRNAPTAAVQILNIKKYFKNVFKKNQNLNFNVYWILHIFWIILKLIYFIILHIIPPQKWKYILK